MTGSNGRNSIWSQELTDKCRDLWIKGYSAKQVGNELGVSRNAVIGKVHRMGLSRHSKGKNNLAPATKQKSLRKVGGFNFVNPDTIRSAKLAGWRSEEAIAIPEPVNGGVGLMECKRGHCKAVTSIATQYASALYCGHPTFGGSSFCAAHFYVYYREPRDRRRQS